ncbi:HTH domain-containing protein [Hungatella sp.]|uniref:BglG family transcription antiterminator n=1 Tax=Hungatella sp. TaxID=2613924 RepID=UPI002A83BDDD|nr:HTH domain-containing protein [Hungatella sp.]
MRSDLKELLGLLSETEYITAVKLSECLGVSPKTVRNRLKELNEIGQKYGAVIDAKSWHGFILCQEKEGGIERLKLELEQGGGLPDSNEDRTNYLLAYLLNHSDYVKIEELSDFLCVSRSTLQSSVREVEEILSQYHIRISRKPNYGIRVEGSEFDIRRCIGECFVRRNMMESGVQLYSEAEMAFLADEILRLTGKYKVSLTEGAFELLITQIYVALKRIKHGCCVEIPETADMKKHVTERRLAEELAGILEKWQNAAYDEISLVTPA